MRKEIVEVEWFLVDEALPRITKYGNSNLIIVKIQLPSEENSIYSPTIMTDLGYYSVHGWRNTELKLLNTQKYPVLEWCYFPW